MTRALATLRPPLTGSARALGRLGRLWKGYLILATGLAGMLGAVMLTVQYFVILPLFAWSAKSRPPRVGWQPARPVAPRSPY